MKAARLPQLLSAVVCFSLFFLMRYFSESRSLNTVIQELERPALPAPEVSLCHPWLLKQQGIEGACPEIVRDLERVEEVCAAFPEFPKHQLLEAMIEGVLALQEQIPLQFPQSLYSVLALPAPVKDPFSFYVYKRLYLGETDLGLPFYLDVRVFEPQDASFEQIKNWHLGILEGSREILLEEGSQSAYLCQGKRNSDYPDPSHGFSDLFVTKGLYLHFYEQSNKLFICYAEAPLSTFISHLDIFYSIFN